MELIIAGGYGEHGRNCFLLQKAGINLMLDCGILDGEGSPWPDISREEIEKTEYVFLTHSHRDHVGAVGWLKEQGLNAVILMTKETMRQICTKDYARDLNDVLYIEEGSKPGEWTELKEGLSYTWGYSGHCGGSVWYQICWEGETIVYSGDYQENSLVYQCNPIRGAKAKLAILDCAHRETDMGAVEKRREVLNILEDQVQKNVPVLLPVPKYGRGMELLVLCRKYFPQIPVFLDAHLLGEFEGAASGAKWADADAAGLLKEWNESGRPGVCGTAPVASAASFYLIADAHLDKEENRGLAEEVLFAGGTVLLTGKNKPGGGVEGMEGREGVRRLPYPHHQNVKEARELASKNEFEFVLPFHCWRKEVWF